MRLDILKLLRTIVRVAAQVAAVGELVMAAHQQQRENAGQALDLDAVRTPQPQPDGQQQPAAPAPATGYPADPSAAH